MLKSLPVLSIFNLIGRSSTLISLFLFTPLYIKVLGFQDFGVIGVFHVAVAVLGILDGALSSTFLRYSAYHKENGRAPISLLHSFEKAYLLYVLVVVTLGILSYIFPIRSWILGSTSENDPAFTLYAALMFAALSQIFINLYYSGLIGLGRIAEANFLQFFIVTLRTGGVFLVFDNDEISLESIFYWYSIVNIFFIWVCRSFFVRYSKPLNQPRGGVYSEYGMTISSYFLSMLGMAIISFLLSYMDRAILAATLPLDLYGRWVALLALTTLPTLVATAVGYAFMPQVTSMIEAGDNEKVKSFYFKSVVVCISLAFLVSIIVCNYVSQMIFSWLGSNDGYSSLKDAFYIQVIANLIQAVTVIPYFFSLSIGKPSKSLKIGAIAGASSVLLLLILVPRYGVFGATIVSLTIGLISLPFNIYMLHANSIKINLLPAFYRALFFSSLFGLFFYFVIRSVEIPQVSRATTSLQLAVVGLASILLWAGFLFIMKCSFAKKKLAI